MVIKSKRVLGLPVRNGRRSSRKFQLEYGSNTLEYVSTPIKRKMEKKTSNFQYGLQFDHGKLTEFFIEGSKLYYTVFHNIARNCRCSIQIDTVSRKIKQSSLRSSHFLLKKSNKLSLTTLKLLTSKPQMRKMTLRHSFSISMSEGQM